MVAALEESEKEKVENHRRNFFRELLPDVPADDIEQLVHSHVSPHEVRKLKKKGWPSEFIIKVLL